MKRPRGNIEDRAATVAQINGRSPYAEPPSLCLPLAAQAADPLPDFVGLVDKNSQAVVNVNTVQTLKTSAHGQMPFPQLPEDSPFQDFFKRFFQGPGQQQPREHKQRSLGSGFLISPDGYILTNAHVVKDASQVNVTLYDHSQSSATVVGMDEQTDVALLKIDGDHLPTVSVGDSDQLRVGEWVLAIGEPFGLDYSATQGIVSAIGRSLPNDVYVPFIQTDVAVNPGNSGGPLFNTDGQVVGINSQIFSNTGGYMGLSFAVPINVAMDVVDQIKSEGHVTHGWLGVTVQPVSPGLAEAFGLDKPRGLLIAKITPDSPAAKGGLKAGDVILSYNGKTIEEPGELAPMVGATDVGDKVKVKVLRKGHERTVKITIAALPEKEQLAENGPEATSLNVVVADLSKEQRDKLGLDSRGVLVQSVGPGPAAKAGVHPGDVLLAVNGHDIDDVRTLAELIDQLPKGKHLPLLIERHQEPLFLALTLPT